LEGADLTEARLGNTNFANVDFTSVIGLETCIHGDPSTIDHRTLQKSGPLPLAFLRGVGLPDTLIEYLPSIFNQAIQHYSCFISYSSKDDEFAHRIHADLQNIGVRCWFAPHDLRIGDEILDALDAAIRLREKVVLILSEHSIKSGWVKDEVTAGFEEERQRGHTVLFPVRLDEAVMNTKEAWAAKLRARNIGDFRKWKDHDAYKQSLARVLRDLTKPQNSPGHPGPSTAPGPADAPTEAFYVRPNSLGVG
jgi:TIR domain